MPSGEDIHDAEHLFNAVLGKVSCCCSQELLYSATTCGAAHQEAMCYDTSIPNIRNAYMFYTSMHGTGCQVCKVHSVLRQQST